MLKINRTRIPTPRRLRHRRYGVTLIELVVVMSVTTVMVLVAGAILVDSQAGWRNMYESVNGDPVSDARRAQRAFEAIGRRASRKLIDIEDTQLIAYDYEKPGESEELDRYVRLYEFKGSLLAEYGLLMANGKARIRESTVTLAQHVQSIRFSNSGTAIHMLLTLDDGSGPSTIIATAVRHNE